MAAISTYGDGDGFSTRTRTRSGRGIPNPMPTPTPSPDPTPPPGGIGNTGYSGGLDTIFQKMSTPQTGNYGSVMGADAGKFGDPNKHDFKYDTLRTLSMFDPRGGFTPEVINALNGLGYGTFSGSGDKLSLSGAKNAKDAADFSNQDWIYAYDANSPATKWNFGDGGAAPQSPEQAAYGPDPMAALSMLAPSLYAPPQYQQPQGSQMPAIFSDPAFWSQLVSAMQPQYAPGYSNAPTPSFGGAQYGTSRQPVAQQNPQIAQLLTQLFAGLAGGG